MTRTLRVLAALVLLVPFGMWYVALVLASGTLPERLTGLGFLAIFHLIVTALLLLELQDADS